MFFIHTGIDFYIGLPYSENYRCAKAHEFPIMSWETFTASRYYPSIWAAFTDSTSLISKVLENPKEFKLVSIAQLNIVLNLCQY